MSSASLRTLLCAAACAALSAPAWAGADLPAAQGSITFSGFENPDGSPNHGCDRVTAGAGAAPCTGTVPFTDANGELQVLAHHSGQGSITGGTAPSVQSKLAADGGNDLFGLGVPKETTQLTYFVTVEPLTALGPAGLLIPLTFDDAGFISGSVDAKGELTAQASTQVTLSSGRLIVDGQFGSFFDQAHDTVDASSLDEGYSNAHQVVFDFRNNLVTVAQVSLKASCGLSSSGLATGNCLAFADPFVGFDQGAFDTLIGPNTFDLSDAFRIVTSSGLDPEGVPEPASWALMIAGIGLTGAMLRGRRQDSTIEVTRTGS
jgi:hypothetical protein